MVFNKVLVVTPNTAYLHILQIANASDVWMVDLHLFPSFSSSLSLSTLHIPCTLQSCYSSLPFWLSVATLRHSCWCIWLVFGLFWLSTEALLNHEWGQLFSKMMSPLVYVCCSELQMLLLLWCSWDSRIWWFVGELHEDLVPSMDKWEWALDAVMCMLLASASHQAQLQF